jgi:hypothetical protein
MKKLTIIALLTLTLDICLAQSFDVENERLPGVTTITIKSFNGCCSKKGYWAKYYFNEKGQAVKSENYFKLKKLAEDAYLFDSLGNLTHSIQTYSINDKNRIDTNLTHYVYDSEKRVIKKTDWTSPERSWTEEYEDFNGFDKPTKTISYSSSNNDTSIQVTNYNQQGQLTKILFQESDSLRTIEIIDYNEQGDIKYSLIPSIVGKEDELLTIWVGGSRHAPEEMYEYTYDDKNRWTQKYVAFKDRKVLLETRKFK